MQVLTNHHVPCVPEKWAQKLPTNVVLYEYNYLSETELIGGHSMCIGLLFLGHTVLSYEHRKCDQFPSRLKQDAIQIVQSLHIIPKDVTSIAAQLPPNPFIHQLIPSHFSMKLEICTRFCGQFPLPR